MVCSSKTVIFLCLLSVAAPAPITILSLSYTDFKYSESMEVKNKQEAKFDCSGTFPKGSTLRWYRERDDGSGIILEVTDEYWKSEFEAEYQISTSYDPTSNYHMSQLTIRTVKDDYAADYYCKAVNKNGVVLIQSQEITLEVTGGSKNCQVPVVTGIMGQRDKNKNWTTLSWTVDPPLKSDWCKGSKLLWFIRYCPWDSIDQIPDNLTTIDPDGEEWSAWMDLDKRQRMINMMDISDNKYYLFEVGWRSKHKDVFHYKYASEVFYFGQQVGARIVSVKDVTVKAGEKAELSCTVDGLPQPKVIWTVALQDSNPRQGSYGSNQQLEAVAPFVKKVYIDNASSEHQRKYTCLAKNTIIKDGVKTTVIDTATMRLTVQG